MRGTRSGQRLPRRAFPAPTSCSTARRTAPKHRLLGLREFAPQRAGRAAAATHAARAEVVVGPGRADATASATHRQASAAARELLAAHSRSPCATLRRNTPKAAVGVCRNRTSSVSTAARRRRRCRRLAAGCPTRDAVEAGGHDQDGHQHGGDPQAEPAPSVGSAARQAAMTGGRHQDRVRGAAEDGLGGRGRLRAGMRASAASRALASRWVTRHGRCSTDSSSASRSQSGDSVVRSSFDSPVSRSTSARGVGGPRTVCLHAALGATPWLQRSRPR